MNVNANVNVNTYAGIKLKRFIDVKSLDAFNGALIPFDGGYLVFYRPARLRCHLSECAFLDRNMVFQHTVKMPADMEIEDVRVAEHDGSLWVSGTYVAEYRTKGVLYIKLYRCHVRNGNLVIDWKAEFKKVEAWPDYKLKYEKNWQPLVHDGKLYYVYSLNPHIILDLDLDARTVRRLHSTCFTESLWPVRGRSHLPGIGDSIKEDGHNWGISHLSTPPVLLSDGNYLSLFRSTVYRAQNPDNGSWTGAYIFNGKPPFQVLKIADTPLLTPEDSDGYDSGISGYLRQVYAQSLLVDEARDSVMISGGDSGREVSVFELRLSEVLETVKPVKAYMMRYADEITEVI